MVQIPQSSENRGQFKIGVTTLATGGCGHDLPKRLWRMENPNRRELVGTQRKRQQLKATFGPHLYLQIKQWNGCKAEVLGLKTPLAVSACEFQLEQAEKGSLKATVTVVSSCALSVPAAKCQIQIFPGIHTGGNEHLNEVKSKNAVEFQSVLATAAVGGISGEGAVKNLLVANLRP